MSSLFVPPRTRVAIARQNICQALLLLMANPPNALCGAPRLMKLFY